MLLSFLLVALIRDAQPLGTRTVVVAPCGTPVGSSILQMLRRRPEIAVRALASTEAEASAARVSACGAKLCGNGRCEDLCASSFPSLDVVVARTDRETRDAVAGAMSLIVLTDEGHPRIMPLPNGDAVVVAAEDDDARRCGAVARRLVDAAVAERVPHVVLLSCLDADTLPRVLASRGVAGGVAETRRALEAKLRASGSRHSVIRAAPIAESDEELRAIDARARGDRPPLVARPALARALLNAALDASNARRGVYELASSRGPGVGHYGVGRRAGGA